MAKTILDYQTYHLVGIKGVAITALALILRDLGKTVTGSDTAEQFLTDRLLKKQPITVHTDFKPQHLDGAEVVIYGASHKASLNPEVVAAKQQNIPCFHLAEVFGFLSQLKLTVAVAGCHGKTTTSALLSYVLEQANYCPSYAVGSAGFMDKASGKWDSGQWFVLEADEYLVDPFKKRQAKFLFYHPQALIVTNLDYDHPDFYPDFQAVKLTFAKLCQRLPKNGLLVINGDDQQLLTLAKNSGKPFFSYGYQAHNHYQIKDRKQRLVISYQKKELLELQPNLVGKHNYLNLTAAVAFLHQAGFLLEQLAPGLNAFAGAKRRLELIAKTDSFLVFDDYAHHPAEISASLAALKSRYPQHRLALFFQPHTYSRLQQFTADFASALSTVDYLALLPVFASAREAVQKESGLKLLLALLPPNLATTLINKPSDWQAVVKESQKKAKKWVYITMGAGDIDKYLPLLVKAVKKTNG